MKFKNSYDVYLSALIHSNNSYLTSNVDRLIKYYNIVLLKWWLLKCVTNLSMEMAIKVNTLAATDKMAMKFDTLQ